jgi:hypothetical protein
MEPGYAAFEPGFETPQVIAQRRGNIGLGADGVDESAYSQIIQIMFCLAILYAVALLKKVL